MAKKIVSIIIFIILILFLFSLSSLKQYNNFITYEVNSQNGIKNININIDNVKLNVIPTKSNQIKITRNTLNKTYERVEYSSSYVDNTLDIRKFTKTEGDIDSKDEITVEIPMDTKLDSFNITITNSQLNIESLEANEFDINSKEYLDLNVNNSTFIDSNINSEQINSSFSNTLIKNTINYNVYDGVITNDLVTGNKENIANIGDLEYNNSNSRFGSTTMKNSNVSMNFLLGAGTKYHFKALPDDKDYDNLDYKYGVHYYNEELEDGDIYEINANNNELNKIDVTTKVPVGV